MVLRPELPKDTPFYEQTQCFGREFEQLCVQTASNINGKYRAKMSHRILQTHTIPSCY